MASSRSDAPTRNELESGVHALGGLFDALNWIEHDQVKRPAAELAEVKHSLVMAGRLICGDFGRRF